MTGGRGCPALPTSPALASGTTPRSSWSLPCTCSSRGPAHIPVPSLLPKALPLEDPLLPIRHQHGPRMYLPTEGPVWLQAHETWDGPLAPFPQLRVHPFQPTDLLFHLLAQETSAWSQSADDHIPPPRVSLAPTTGPWLASWRSHVLAPHIPMAITALRHMGSQAPLEPPIARLPSSHSQWEPQALEPWLLLPLWLTWVVFLPPLPLPGE